MAAMLVFSAPDAPKTARAGRGRPTRQIPSACRDSGGITLSVRRQRPSCRYPRPVLIKARLKGHEFGVLTLAGLLGEGDPAVAADDEGYLSFIFPPGALWRRWRSETASYRGFRVGVMLLGGEAAAHAAEAVSP